MRILLKIGIISSAAAAVLVAVFAVRQVFFDTATADFKNSVVLWILIAVFAVCAGVTIVALLVAKPNVRKIGFYVMHIGMVLILIGSLTYYLFGVKIHLTAYENTDASSARNLASIIETAPVRGDDYIANFNNISVGVKSITCRYYDPEYAIYELGNDTPVKDEIYPDKDGVYDFGKYGKFNKRDLIAEDGRYVQQQFENGAIAYPMVSESGKGTLEHVEVVAVLQDRKTGESVEKEFTINNPVNFSGWKVILMDAHEDEGDVQFFMKYDPGEYITLAGMWLTIIGSFACAFLTFKPKKARGGQE